MNIMHLPGFTKPAFGSFLYRADWMLPSPTIPIVPFFLVKSSSLPGRKPTGLFPESEGVFTGDTDWLLGQPVSSGRQESIVFNEEEEIKDGQEKSAGSYAYVCSRTCTLLMKPQVNVCE